MGTAAGVENAEDRLHQMKTLIPSILGPRSLGFKQPDNL